MADDLREKIAEVLAGHAALYWPGSAKTICACHNLAGPFDPIGSSEAAQAEHRRHVAEAILAAIGDRREVTEYAQHPDHGPIWTAFVGSVRAHFKRTITQFEHTGPWRSVDTDALTQPSTEEKGL